MTNKRLQLNINLFKTIYLIRKSEEKIVEEYESNEMKTPMHMSMGEEAIVAGVCRAFGKEDILFGTYRSHALYLACGGEVDKFFAEMYGKETGALKGKGGSMHLSAPEKGLLATSAVVASTIPLAVGAAYSLKLRKKSAISTVFFGDGAIDEGSFWESFNMACLFKLPVMFVCEDNGFAVHTTGIARHGYKSIADIVSKFNCEVFEKVTTDAEQIYELAQKARNSIKKRHKPAFLYFKYYRYLEHVGTHEDFDANYRSRKEFEKWLKKDPLSLQLKKLKFLGISQQKIEGIQKAIDLKIARGVKSAKEARFPKDRELFTDIFHEN